MHDQDRTRAILRECNPETATRFHLRMEGGALDLAILNALASASGDTPPMSPAPGRIRWYVHRETLDRMLGWANDTCRIPRLDHASLARTLYIHHRQELARFRAKFQHSGPREWVRAAALDTFARAARSLSPALK